MQNPQKKLAEYIIQNKEKFSKLEIQKAQQFLFNVEVRCHNKSSHVINNYYYGIS